MSARREILAGVCALGVGVSTGASAQCPSNASSCVVCHEGGEQPPSLDGTPWHTDHALVDVCVACHGGDRERMDVTAHEGMGDPLGQPATTCAACHPDGAVKAMPYLELRDRNEPLGTSEAPPPDPSTSPPPGGVAAVDGVLLAVAAGLAAVLALAALRAPLSPAGVWRALRAPTWPPAVAGAGLGVVVAVSEAVCGRPIAASGGVDRLAAFVGAPLFPESTYYRFVVPPAITWQVWMLVGLVAGAAASALLSGTFRRRWLPDAGWTEVHGPSKRVRLALAFGGAALVQIGAGIAGGCTSGLAISGGAVLAPAAFLFVAGMFAGGIPTAWLWSRRAR